MKIDILTYLFEIINFFVLLWILKKLLYNPIISVLKKRKDYIDEGIRKAEEAESRYQRLQKEYEELLKEIEETKKSKLAEITQEIEKEREKMYENMRKELDAEREKFLESLETHKKEVLTEIKEETIKTSLELVSKILYSFTDKHLHKKLLDLAVEGIKNINPEERDNLAQELKEHSVVYVETAYPLEDEDISNIKNAIKETLGVEVEINQTEKKDLVTGVKLHIASKLIDVSLEGQLLAFETLLRKRIEV